MLLLSCAGMSFVIQHGVIKAASGDVSGKMVQWCPDDGPAVTEALALWLQPDSTRVRIMAGSVPRAIIDAITKLCPSAELRSLRDMKSDLSESQEQELVESVQKGPRKQACLLNQLKSKYIMADAMSAVIRHQSDKLPLAEWSSSRVEKKKDVRTIWNLFFKDVLGDTDAQSDVENEQRVELAQDEAGGGANLRDKVIMLLDALHPITAMESDYLHSILADQYNEDIDMEVLTYPMIGLLSLVRSRVAVADEQEVVWWKQVFISFSKKISAQRRAEDVEYQEKEAKRQRIHQDSMKDVPHAAPVNQGLVDAAKRSAKGSNKSPVVVDDLDKQPADAVLAHGI